MEKKKAKSYIFKVKICTFWITLQCYIAQIRESGPLYLYLFYLKVFKWSCTIYLDSP